MEARRADWSREQPRLQAQLRYLVPLAWHTEWACRFSYLDAAWLALGALVEPFARSSRERAWLHALVAYGASPFSEIRPLLEDMCREQHALSRSEATPYFGGPHPLAGACAACLAGGNDPYGWELNLFYAGYAAPAFSLPFGDALQRNVERHLLEPLSALLERLAHVCAHTDARSTRSTCAKVARAQRRLAKARQMLAALCTKDGL